MIQEYRRIGVNEMFIHGFRFPRNSYRIKRNAAQKYTKRAKISITVGCIFLFFKRNLTFGEYHVFYSEAAFE